MVSVRVSCIWRDGQCKGIMYLEGWSVSGYHVSGGMFSVNVSCIWRDGQCKGIMYMDGQCKGFMYLEGCSV